MNEFVKLEDITEADCKETISRNLNKLLEENYYTVSLLSKRSGLSSSTINNYLSKKTIPTVNNIVRLSKALNCSIPDLIE